MSAGRKYVHVEPRHIAGADLPHWMRSHDGTWWVIPAALAVLAALAAEALGVPVFATLTGWAHTAWTLLGAI
ncbi:MAG: hypothetical protein H7Z19_09885 [Chitinophagaceae bacterium]|nr:hypothetical protein [Rubrivivax sp.]